MGTALTAIVCTHNPRRDYLEAALASLKVQIPLSGERAWELLLIDNASVEPLAAHVDLGWHRDARVVREERLGLTHARLRSFHEARGEVLVYIDDDNVLDGDYLHNTLDAFDADTRLGAAGGKAIPRYEIEPPPWFDKLGISLACRDFGDRLIEMSWPDPYSRGRAYPQYAPIGAGLGIRREALATYVEATATNQVRVSLGRRGLDLSSGEDNDIVMSLLGRGWKVAYLPSLRLEHLIPAHRLSKDYLERYAYSSSKTWVQVLDVHGIRPWPKIPPWTVALRKARAYVRFRAWEAVDNRIRWRAACGMIEGRATLGAER